MSAREWEPGEVLVRNDDRGMVTRSGGTGSTALYVEFASGKTALLREVADDSLPLIVIDPKDLAAIELLQDLYVVAERSGLSGLSMQSALHKFANPTPPKPEEPVGLGAVVEDVKGRRFVVDFVHDDGEQRWYGPTRETGDTYGHLDYGRIAAVRILNDGAPS